MLQLEQIPVWSVSSTVFIIIQVHISEYFPASQLAATDYKHKQKWPQRKKAPFCNISYSAAELRFFFLFITLQKTNSTIPVTTSGIFIKSKAAGFQPEPTLNMQLICTEILRKETKKTYHCLNSPTFWLSALSCAAVQRNLQVFH